MEPKTNNTITLMVQLEINLCFFAFYELVPDEEEEGGKITQWVWGGAETIAILEVSISRSRCFMC